MWQGLGNCYVKLSRHTDALKAYKRAVLAGSTDPNILSTLARLSEDQGDISSAQQYHAQIIAEAGEMTPLAAKSHIWLARIEIARREWGRAEGHVNEVLKGHYELDEARGIQREIRSLKEK
jgi:anaphase-promoting complex subunit 8